MACGSAGEGSSKTDGNSNTPAAAGGTQTCKITLMGYSADSTPLALETTGSPTGLQTVGEKNPVWAALNGPKANGYIGCLINTTSDAGATTQVSWVAEMDQPGPLKPYMISSDTAKLTSMGHTPLSITVSGGADTFSCGLTVPVCPGGGSDCKPNVVGTFNFDVTYAKPSPLQPGNAMGWFVKATGHAECLGTNDAKVSIDIVFDVK
jgi:hypothetical protein